MTTKKLNYLIHTLIVIATVKTDKLCDMTSKESVKKCFRKQILVTLAHSPNQLAVDRTSNHLYFSFDSGQGEYIPAKVKIGESTIYVLKGVKDAFAIANDNTTGEMYFGGSHGIYRYHPGLRKLKRLAIENLDIWWLVIRKTIFFIKFPSLSAFKYENKTIKHMPELKNHSVHQFVFDNDDNILFINNTGLFKISREEESAVLIADYPRFLGMATDNHGEVYLCTEDGIFIFTRPEQALKKVITLQGVLGLTFDRSNNLIYSDSHELVKLIPTNMNDYYDSQGRQ